MQGLCWHAPAGRTSAGTARGRATIRGPASGRKRAPGLAVSLRPAIAMALKIHDWRKGMKREERPRGKGESAGELFDDANPTKVSGNVEEPSRPQERGGERRRKLLGKALIVVILTAAVVGLIMQKAGKDEGPPARETALEFGPGTVLASVNGNEITLGELEGLLEGLPLEYQAPFRRAKHGFLQEMITRELLVQEARREEIAETRAYREAIIQTPPPSEQQGDLLINVLLRTKILSSVEVTDDDVLRFYEEHKGELRGAPDFEEVKEYLRASVRQQEEYRAVEEYMTELRGKADITLNEEWIAAQEAAAAENPLDRALKTGRPVLADFGRGTCIPCKMMKPILDDLKRQYKGKAEILIIETNEYPALTRRCGVRAIPTQIFYDASGAEVYRHQGFMPREEIVEKLAEMEVK